MLTVNEDREQTRAIHDLQRQAETLEGMIAREERQQVLRLHRNAQRLLRPLRVVNPYAKRLRFPDASTRMRRDHMKYLALIRATALLHQHQREHKIHPHASGPIEYIEVTPADIALANELAHEVLGRSVDELAPQTRRLLSTIDGALTRECQRRRIARCDLRFTNREVREWSGWSDFQVRTHMHKLITMEYVLVHRGGRGQSFVYELLYEGGGRDGCPFLAGLIDPASLELQHNNEHPEGGSEHPNGGSERSTSPQRALNEVGSSGPQIVDKASPESALPKIRVKTFKKTHGSGNGKDVSADVVDHAMTARPEV